MMTLAAIQNGKRKRARDQAKFRNRPRPQGRMMSGGIAKRFHLTSEPVSGSTDERMMLLESGLSSCDG